MILTLVISLFFGLVAAVALTVNSVMIRRGLIAVNAIRAEFVSIDRAAAPIQVRRARLVCG